MKMFLTLFIASCFCLSCFAQKKGTVKLYGYEQSVSGGKAPETDEKTGEPIRQRPRTNLFLYAASPSRIYPTEIWIAGTQFGVNFHTIKNTPVEHGDDILVNTPKKILVPQTTDNVIELIPSSVIGVKPSGVKAAKSLAKTNAIVLVYKQGGRFYYQTLSKLEKLQRGSMQ